MRLLIRSSITYLMENDTTGPDVFFKMVAIEFKVPIVCCFSYLSLIIQYFFATIFLTVRLKHTSEAIISIHTNTMEIRIKIPKLTLRTYLWTENIYVF